ncbi:hypothetical protein ALC56_06750 [Trachymyrmex septentrionalis]|uniref:Uncharacterized protein n=1 Tax=Trachymyrmex septentrionalis TaxID=34720 RepID=A0A195FEE7_9HYME|nr:hypothetical protein ALC56_06750 [Trachymyrmex septentrionalis]
MWFCCRRSNALLCIDEHWTCIKRITHMNLCFGQYRNN